jgi:hypothetical protein
MSEAADCRFASRAVRPERAALRFSLRPGTKGPPSRGGLRALDCSEENLHIAQESVAPTPSPVALRVEATLLP